MEGREAVLAELLTNAREHSRLSVLFRETIANRFGLSAAEGECIDFLMEAGTATAGDLAKLTGLTTGAITGLIRRLEKARFVTVTRDPDDKRKVIVRLNKTKLKQGRDLYSSYAAVVIKQVYSRLTISELRTIVNYHRSMTVVLLDQIKLLTASR